MSKSSVKKVLLTVDTVSKFRGAEKKLKLAETEVYKLKAEVAALGKNHIIHENCEAKAFAVQSVRLMDPSGDEAVVTWQDKYSAVDGAKVPLVETAFGKVGLDVNGYVRETAVCKFDGEVFFSETGEFDHDMYDEVLSALDSIARRRGKENPLSMKPVFVVRDDFNSKRWSEIKIQDQPAISAVLPNTVTVK